MVPSAIDGDGDEERAEGRLAAEPKDRPGQCQEHLVDQVLRGGLVADEAARETAHGGVVPIVRLAHGSVVAALEPRDERRIGMSLR
jgi:hypothetical protein